MSNEKIWKDFPAQSSRAALKVEKPRPLVIVPEKLVTTPFGIEEVNMAMERSQLSRQHSYCPACLLLGVFEGLPTMCPIEVHGLDSDTARGNAADGDRSIFLREPSSIAWPVGHEEEEEDA